MLLEIKISRMRLDIRGLDILLIVCFIIPFFILEKAPVSFVRPFYLFANNEWGNGIKSLLGNYSFILAFSIMIIDGIYRFRIKYKISAMILPIFATIVCFYLANGYFNYYNASGDLIKQAMKSLTHKYPIIDCIKLTNPSTPLNERALRSIQCAQVNYENNGIISNIITESGNISLFTPTTEDKKRREKKIEFEKSTKHFLKEYPQVRKSLPYNIAGWLFLPIISVLIGMLIAQKNRRAMIQRIE